MTLVTDHKKEIKKNQRFQQEKRGLKIGNKKVDVRISNKKINFVIIGKRQIIKNPILLMKNKRIKI